MNNVILSSFFVQMKQSLARPTFKFVVFLQPILNSLLFYFILKNNKEINVGVYILVGVGLINLWGTILYSSASDIERERGMGTLEVIFTTPSDFRTIFLGKVLSNIFLGLLSMAISYVMLKFVLNINIIIQNVFLFWVSLLVTVILFAIMSILLAYVFTLSRSARLLMNILEYPIYILCGIVLPINILPKYIQILSYIFPPTWCAKILRECISGIHNMDDFYFSLVILLLMGIVYFFISLKLYNVITKKVRINGSLGVH